MEVLIETIVNKLQRLSEAKLKMLVEFVDFLASKETKTPPSQSESSLLSPELSEHEHYSLDTADHHTESDLTKIKSAIQRLPDNQVRQLASWLQNDEDDLWDQEIKADFQSGKLDSLIAKAEAAIEANQVRELDEVLHDC
ncbi:MAG: hypothetical protein AAGC54_04925 [Cyanobacteria bacterium P01_F01_bin.4]